jgi:hypothetical protein
MRSRYTSISIAIDIRKVLLEINTKLRLLVITCDNASNNRTIANAIKRQLDKSDIS